MPPPPSASSALPSTVQWLRRLAYALPPAGLLVAGSYLWRMESAHDALAASTQAQAGSRAQQLAAAKALQVESLLAAADLGLRQIRDQAADGGLQQLDATVRNLQDALPRGAVGHVSVSDADGRLVYPSSAMQGATRQPLSVTDREPFRVLSQTNTDQLQLGTVVVSRVTGQPGLPLSRPLLPQGRFAGVATMTLVPAFLADALARQQPGLHDTVRLFHADGSTVAGSIGTHTDGVPAGTAAEAPWPFLQPDAPTQGLTHRVSQADGRARLHAWYRLDHLPLVVDVGLDEDTELAPVHTERQRAYQRIRVLVPLSMLLVLAVSWLLLRVAREQAALAASRALLRATLDATGEGALVVGPEGRVLHVNRNLRLMWQLPSGMGEGSAHTALLEHGARQLADPVAFDNLRRQVEASGDMALAPLPCTDGRVLEFQTRAVQLDGATLRLWTLRDVTELQQNRQQLEQRVQERTLALKAANQQLLDTQFAMDSVGIGIEWVDASTLRFVYVNRMAAQMMGYTVAEMLQLRVHDLDMHTSEAEFLQRVRTLRLLGQTRRELVARRRDGSPLPLEVTAFYLEGRDGAPDRVISFLTDISTRKAAEQALVRAKEAAEAANVAKSAFLANMSHEIRTPLNAITGMAYLIGRDRLSPRQAERLGHIQTAARHLVETLNAVLDLSRIEADRLTLDAELVDVRAVVDNVATMLKGKLAAKRLALDVQLQLPPGPWLGDATRLQQALLNYAFNAAKFTEVGHISLRVVPAEDDAERAPDSVLLRFEVHDTGPGLDAATIARLFTPFEQADNSTTRQHGGSGLGLAITAKLARLMGGQAGVDSVPGQGSRFWFTARLQRAGANPAGSAGALPAPPAASAEAVLRQTCSGRSVLLVEDDPANSDVALALLQACCLVVHTAADGLAAVQAAATHTPDLVLMDLQLPLLDGLAATRRIHALPGLATLPVLAFTANAFAEDHARCMAAGMVGVVTKPVNPEDLYGALLPWLAEATAQQAVSPPA